jgi:general secretion pathway protein M
VIVLQRYRGLVAVLVSLTVLLAVLGSVARYVYVEHDKSKKALAAIEPRYARLLGLRDSGAQIEQAVKDAKAAVVRMGYPADRDAAQVGNDLQQIIRKGFEAARLTITNSQVLTTRNEAGVDRISVAIQAEGPLNQLQTVLAALGAESPTIMVDGLNMQPVGRYTDDGVPIMNSRVTVTVLRLQS